MTISLHESATRYADLGYPVFPCVPGRKEPLCSNGCLDATTDLDQIDLWWTQRPNANIGIATNGLLVIDVDCGSTWLEKEEERLLDLAVAPLSLTAREGQQYFFKPPVEGTFRNTTGLLAEKVDTRADGGYVVAPPSVLEGGRRYRWAKSMEIEVSPCDLPEAPVWLTDQLKQKSDKHHAVSIGRDVSSIDTVNVIPSGQRNATLARLAGFMRRAGMSKPEIAAALHESNRLRCKPPIEMREVDRIADSIARYQADEITVALMENHWEQFIKQPGESLFQPITSAQLDAETYELNYLVNGVLVRGQPGVIAGPKKTLKTNISVDLALSLSEGCQFLGRFDVPLAARVGIMSGESGAATLQETARRVAKAKGLKLSACSNLVWCFDVPQLGDQTHIEALGEMIEKHELEVLILDPTYLMMLGIGNDAGNLFIVGKLLKSLGELAQKTGCTPLLCHHLKKSIAEPYEPAELENIAWAGFQEFVRQWILLNRRVKYDPDQGGHHELWMSVGGSAGHSGLWGVDVVEGVRDDIGGRRWEVETLEAGQAYARRELAADLISEEKQERRKQSKFDRNKQRVLSVLQKMTEPESLREICAQAGMRDRTARDALEALVEEGLVDMSERKKGRSRFNGFQLVSQSDQVAHV